MPPHLPNESSHRGCVFQPECSWRGKSCRLPITGHSCRSVLLDESALSGKWVHLPRSGTRVCVSACRRCPRVGPAADWVI
jgi:hypothetical protein